MNKPTIAVLPKKIVIYIRNGESLFNNFSVETSWNNWIDLISCKMLLYDYSNMNDFSFMKSWHLPLTHWGQAPHICVGNLTIIDSDNGLSPARHKAII